MSGRQAKRRRRETGTSIDARRSMREFESLVAEAREVRAARNRAESRRAHMIFALAWAIVVGGIYLAPAIVAFVEWCRS